MAFEVLASGRTPGKRWRGLRVVRDGGQPIGFLASATRNLLRLVDWLPSAYLVGIVAIMVSEKNQRLGDIVAGSIVIRDRRGDSRAPIASFALPQVAIGVDVGAWDVSAISAEELAMLRKFLERRDGISRDARSEIASTLAGRLRPRVAGVPDDVSAEQFLEELVAIKLARGE